ncbi:MAG: hypothetical protein ACI8QF_003614 [Limisphaerales bacterium]
MSLFSVTFLCHFSLSLFSVTFLCHFSLSLFSVTFLCHFSRSEGKCQTQNSVGASTGNRGEWQHLALIDSRRCWISAKASELVSQGRIREPKKRSGPDAIVK